MKQFLLGLCLATSLLLPGCGTETVAPNPKGLPSTESKEGLKKLLVMVADSGTAGSMMGQLKPGIEKVKAIDAKLGADLETDYEALTKTTDAATIKEIATRMAGKL